MLNSIAEMRHVLEQSGKLRSCLIHHRSRQSFGQPACFNRRSEALRSVGWSEIVLRLLPGQIGDWRQVEIVGGFKNGGLFGRILRLCGQFAQTRADSMISKLNHRLQCTRAESPPSHISV